MAEGVLHRTGPISSVTVLDQTLVIVNDVNITFELLEKRSAKYSSRPHQLFAGEMLGWQNSLGLIPYNDEFRRQRKNITKTIGSRVGAARYQQLQEAEAGHFLIHMLDDPSGLLGHIKKEAGAVILKMVYSYNVEPFKNDYLVDSIGRAMDELAQAAVPGAFMVDIFPWLRYLPEWFPGTGWKQTAKEWHADLNAVVEKPFAFVKHQVAAGKDDSSILRHLLGNERGTPGEEYTAKWTALSLYSAGTDTTASSITYFFLAMSVFPQVQQKAQAEIDRVVGRDRLPTFSDRPNLPYVEAILKEVLRWQPVLPMGLPHVTMEEDIVEGYYIPKDAVILANVWHFTRNPEIYHSPLEFKPERFLSTGDSKPEMDPRKLVFGFGRRICPGRLLADSALFVTIAQTLATLTISKRTVDGKVVEPKISPSPGLVSHAEPFETLVEPRSAHHEALIRAIEETHPWDKTDADVLEAMNL